MDSPVDSDILAHHGIKGQKWGVKNGPPYPIQENRKVAKVLNSGNIVEEAIRSGQVSKAINKDKQKRHTKDDHIPGRSYLYGGLSAETRTMDWV